MEGPQIQRREKWVDVPEYEGFKVKLWLNAPQKHWNDLGGKDPKAVTKAFGTLIIEHNGWRDYDGEAYPPAGTPAFFEAIPTELAFTLIAMASKELQALPSSLAPTRRR